MNDAKMFVAVLALLIAQAPSPLPTSRIAEPLQGSSEYARHTHSLAVFTFAMSTSASIAQSQYRLGTGPGPNPSDVLPPLPDPVAAAAPRNVRQIAMTILTADLARLLRAILSSENLTIDSSRSVTLQKPAAAMPAGAPYYYYAGRAQDGRLIFWTSPGLDESGVTPASDDMLLTALGPAIADSGGAGPVWKQRYDAAPDKVLFGEAIALAFRLMVDGIESKANSDELWIEQTIRIGMTRRATYSLLRRRGLVAYNSDYNPGVPTTPPPPTPGGGPQIGGGCDYQPSWTRGEWPYFREPLPKRTGECARIPGQATYVPNPPAFITIGVGMSLSCGVSRAVDLYYDMDDRLKSLRLEDPSVTCL